MASRAALGILMPRHMEYNYRQKKATAQSPAQCLQSLMPFSQLSVKLARKIVWLTVPGCHPCQLQTRSSLPFRDFSRSCWSDVCGEGASGAPHNYFMGTSEYFPGNTAARLVWEYSSPWRVSYATAALWDHLLPRLMQSETLFCFW